MIIHLRELKCPLCRSKDLEKLGEAKYRCNFCGLSFEVVDIIEEKGEEKLAISISETHIEYHHVTSPIGESTFITCPHCKREIYLWFKALEGDPDWINIAVIKGDKKILERVKIPPEEE